MTQIASTSVPRAENSSTENRDLISKKPVAPVKRKLSSELRSRIVMDLKSSLPRIKELHNRVLELPVELGLSREMNSIKWELSKYNLLRSDCCWQSEDQELNNAITALEMCYLTVINKKEFKVRDIIHVVDTLSNLAQTFDCKIKEFEEVDE